MDIFYVIDVHMPSGTKLFVTPSNWIIEKENKVSLPPYKLEKVNVAAMNQESPNGASWNSYSATIYGKFNSFREAHIQLTNFEKTGKFDTTLEPLGRGHRIKAAPNKFTPNESSSEDDSVLTLRKEMDSIKERNLLIKPPKEPAVFSNSGNKSQVVKKISKTAISESQNKRQKRVNKELSRIELPTSKEDAVSSVPEGEKSYSQPDHDSATHGENGLISTNHDNEGRSSLVSSIQESMTLPTNPSTIHDGTIAVTEQNESSSFGQPPIKPTTGGKTFSDENDNTVPWNTQYWNDNTNCSQIAVISQGNGQSSQPNLASHSKKSFREESRSDETSQQALRRHQNFSKSTCNGTKNIQRNKGRKAITYIEEMTSDAHKIQDVENDHSDSELEKEENRKEPDNTIAKMSNTTHQSLKKIESGRSHSLVLLKNQERILKLLESQESLSTVVVSRNLKDRLPVKTMNEFKAINKSLKDEEKRNEFVEFVRQIGCGRKASEATRFVWKQLVKDSCARHFNWLGIPRKDVTVPKKGMSKQRITSLVLDGLRLNQGLQSLTLKDFADYTKDWLRHAPKRDDNAISRENAIGICDSDSADDSED